HDTGESIRYGKHTEDRLYVRQESTAAERQRGLAGELPDQVNGTGIGAHPLGSYFLKHGCFCSYEPGELFIVKRKAVAPECLPESIPVIEPHVFFNVFVPGEAGPQRFQQLLESPAVQRFAVHDDTVEIEYYRLEHPSPTGYLLNFAFSRSANVPMVAELLSAACWRKDAMSASASAAARTVSASASEIRLFSRSIPSISTSTTSPSFRTSRG